MDKALNKIVQVLQQEFPIQKVYLFGSRAEGSSHQNSDYDLVFVISNSTLNPIERAQKAHLALWDAGVHLPTDLFFYTTEEFEKGKKLFNSIPEIAFTMGIEVQIDSP